MIKDDVQRHDPDAPDPAPSSEPDPVRRALGIAGVTLFTQDLTQKFTWVHGHARGQDATEWVGKRERDLMPAEIAARSEFEKNLALMKRETRHWTHDVEIGGEMRSVQSRFAPLTDDKGDVVGLIGAILDLTEERRIEDSLRVSERLLRRVLDSLYAFVAVLDVEGRLLEVNRATLSAAGLTRDKVIGRFLWDSDWWVEPDESERLQEAATRACTGETIRRDVEMSFPGAGRVTMDLQIAPLRDSAGEVVLLVCSGVDVTARKNAERELRQALLRTEIALSAGHTGVWELEPATRRRTWDSRMRELWGFGPDDELTDENVHDAIAPTDRLKFIESKKLALAVGGSNEIDVEFRLYPRTGGERWIRVRGRVFEDGGPKRLVGIARDITDTKEHDAHIHFLMREVVHRSKNLLAVIQAMARQTAATGGTAREFEERFTARLQALAGSHDLLVRDDWRGASARELVRSQLGHYADLVGTRIDISGPDVVLKPEAAQNIGLALHELSTNAAKYGALANAEGHITIGWAIEGEEDERRFIINWVERDGPRVEAPTREGFGHRVMKRIAANALEGEVSLDFPAEGLEWRLSIPATYLIGRDSREPLDPRRVAAGAIRAR